MSKDESEGRIVTFYSYKGGTGRTMAVANVAWLLASNGLRVLAMDWDLESPGLHRFFRPFLDDSVMSATTGVIDIVNEYRWEAASPREHDTDWHLEYAKVVPHAVSLEWRFPKQGTLDFLSAGQQNRDYSSLVSAFDWDTFYERLAGGSFLEALRADIKRNYDYCLIDSRTGLSDIADICTIDMPDIVVDCFTMSDQGIDGAARVAGAISGRHDRHRRILPVPMRVDDGEKKKADAGRAYARSRFERFLTDMSAEDRERYWGAVEVPYKRFYAFEETLAVFGDAPQSPGSLLASFERLTEMITQGQVTGLVPMEEPVRLRWLESFTRREPALHEEILLSYAPEDRMWADWIAIVLRQANFRVVPQALSAVGDGNGATAADGVVAVVSAAYLQDFQAAAWATATEDGLNLAPRLTMLRISGDLRLGPPFSEQPTVDLFRLSSSQAAEAILRAVGKPAAVVNDPAVLSARFPGTVPAIWNVPPRNAAFTGRDKALETLRDQLVGGNQAVVLPQALYGLGGVGKTQVALEYAYRFQADYDVVWWIAAEQPDLINPALAELARRLHLPVGDSIVEAAEAVRETLRRGEPYKRWLLIFDNAGEPEDLRRYMPGGPGHIIVTSRNPTWVSIAKPLEVDVFSREEGLEHLMRTVPGLNPDDALRVAEALGYLPLAIAQAAAWLRETGQPASDYVELLQSQAAVVLSANQAADYPSPVAATWNVSLSQLKERSPAAERLLQLCAFFSPDPISLSLLYSKETMKVLVPFDKSLQGEKLVLGRVIREISRFALAKTDQGSNTLQVHRLVQAVIRDQMTQEERDKVSHVVHRILVEARPRQGEVDDPENWEKYDLIWPHLLPSNAETCVEEETKQLLTERVRYWWKRGDYDNALQLGERLSSYWEQKFGQLEQQRLHLLTNIANVQRSLGMLQEAYELEQWVWGHQRELFGEDHPHTLLTASGVAADLRALGQFREALAQDRDVYERWKEVYGEDHPRALRSANNLAVSYRLVGDWRNAKELDGDIYQRMLQALGPMNPNTLNSAQNFARDMREAGDFEASIALLRQTLQHYADLNFDDYPIALRATKSLAVSLRRAGQRKEAAEHARDVYSRYIRLYPSDPEAKAAALELACCMSSAGDKAAARDMARNVMKDYSELLGPEHPYTSAAANNLCSYLRGLGALDEARGMGERSLAALRRHLGDTHPFTLTCSINVANCAADQGELDTAERMEQRTLVGLIATLGNDHPDVLACQANLSITLRSLGRDKEADELRRRTLAAVTVKLGETHPCTEALQKWRRVNRDLEPQPT
ncbi:FxSxx-COOH system tetratricopeptide repeat protein [Nonomuraea sp. NPDC049400]|uniref:FxSxx-COOH system tetratricopeptide repeat protein n=1 Tax=Nonomuraea sp. NPDC049400 TaxID=3364352 RepID=UPI00379E2399